MPPPPGADALAESPPRYSLVFLVHGDADYVYHDARGEVRRADEVVVAQALAVAERNPLAEVFVFHEMKRRKTLFLFPRRDGRAYYARHGGVVARRSYWRDQGESRYDAELGFYERFAAARSAAPIRLFFYFGHELPVYGGAGYDASYSQEAFTVRDLAEGVAAFVGPSSKFDVLTLATCFGGTPRTIGALAPYARYIVASPDNLHLSSFDLGSLASLDVGPEDAEVAAFADRFAGAAFERLAREVQTAVSVVVYDANDVQGFVGAVSGAYDRTLEAAQARPPVPLEYCDCADDSAYVVSDMGRGLTVRYRAPHFGRMKNRSTHSGWECRRPAGSAR